MAATTASTSSSSPSLCGRYITRLITGTSNIDLAKAVATHVGVELTPSVVGKFADGEIKMQVLDCIRVSDMYIIQPTCPPNVDSAIQELVLLIHTCKLSSAARVTAVIPYYGYGRQDRKRAPRVPISALCVANQILSAEPDRLLFVDLHNSQLQGFFGSKPTDHLSAATVFAKKITELFDDKKSDLVIVSPDAAGVSRAKILADMLKIAAISTIIKRRLTPDGPVAPDSIKLVGEVNNKIVIIYDDIVDTATTLVTATRVLAENGAKEIYACVSHGVFSGDALKLIEESKLNKVFVTDTISQSKVLAQSTKVECLSMAPIIGAAITTIHNECSVGALNTGAS